MPNIEILTTDTFRVLAYLYDHQGKEDKVVRVTQTEISEVMNINRGKINNIFKSLIDNEYLEQDKAHIGRYSVTSYGVKAVELFRKSEKK